MADIDRLTRAAKALSAELDGHDCAKFTDEGDDVCSRCWDIAGAVVAAWKGDDG